MSKPVVLITNTIAPYRIPLFNRLSELLHHEFEVLFLSKHLAERQWLTYENEICFRYSILSTDDPGQHVAVTSDLAISILSRLRTSKPDVVVIGGYDSLPAWAAWLHRRLSPRSRLVMWSGTHQHSVGRSDILRGVLKRVFVRGSDSFVTYGQWATDYLISLGASRRRIVTACNVGDIDFFVREVDQIRSSPGFLFERSKYAKTVFLASGQLIPRKGFVELLSALKEIASNDWELLLVGSGPLLENLQSLAANLGGRVHFPGFLHRQDLAKIYAMADIGIVPSTTEVGSIVLSEYLAAGLFTIGSSHDASAYNLIASDAEGIVVDPLDQRALLSALEEVLRRHIDGQIDRKAVRRALEGKGIRDYAEAIKSAVSLAAGL